MKKAELIKELSKATGFAKEDIHLVVDALPRVVERALIEEPNEKVVIFGIASIGWRATKPRAAFTRPHPKTGEPMEVPAKPAGRCLKMSISPTLKRRTRD
jgi:nucleoid DNA-binding protein